ncbi:MAG: AgmX/PglI C-terminal domain-containing protein [Deltaproteobacteria bacterium]|nr:AgmX/PglI C-terminal domain-containing protein [Deltaproteobacteria bacterium]
MAPGSGDAGLAQTSKKTALQEASEYGAVGLLNTDAGTASGVQVSDGGAVIGRLPPEVIQQVVRNEYTRLRACYEDGLRREPTLTGRVATRFVIGLDGTVSQVTSGGSDLPDRVVQECIFDVFRTLKFPRPNGGIITVVYPIRFSPGEAAPSASVPPPPPPPARPKAR